MVLNPGEPLRPNQRVTLRIQIVGKHRSVCRTSHLFAKGIVGDLTAAPYAWVHLSNIQASTEYQPPTPPQHMRGIGLFPWPSSRGLSSIHRPPANNDVFLSRFCGYSFAVRFVV